jgi:adenosylcobinamide-phosphate synthase
MSFLSLLAAIVLGYYRATVQPDLLRGLFSPYARLLENNLNDGRSRHGVIAWVAAVLFPVVAIAAAYLILGEINALLGMAFAIGVLFLVLHFGKIVGRPEQVAARLRESNLDEARRLLEGWQECETHSFTAPQVARSGIETTLRHAHHDLFAPIFWFVLLGPAGALLYRLAFLLKEEWAGTNNAFVSFTRDCFDWLDWLPARFTAASFAVVGDFEDAVYCWRTQAAMWPDQALGIILASGAGALGVRLGDPLPCKGVIEYRPELGVGDEADADYLQSATGLVWRVVAVMLVLLLLLTFAHWLGN